MFDIKISFGFLAIAWKESTGKASFLLESSLRALNFVSYDFWIFSFYAVAIRHIY